MVQTLHLRKKKIIREFVKHRGNVIIFLFIWLAGMIFVKNFANLDNNLNIVTQSAIPAISCLGMTFVLMTGGIDLSVGYTLGFCSYMFGMFAIRMELPLIAALILTLIIGGICGLVNGLLVQIVKIPAFIVTLGTGYIIFGIAQIVSNGSAITNLPEHVLAIARAKFLGISSMVYIAAAVVLICWFVLHKSTYGRTLMSVGLNIKASRLSGVRAGYVTVMAYVTCGGLFGTRGGTDGDQGEQLCSDTWRNGIHSPGDNGGDSGGSKSVRRSGKRVGVRTRRDDHLYHRKLPGSAGSQLLYVYGDPEYYHPCGNCF